MKLLLIFIMLFFTNLMFSQTIINKYSKSGGHLLSDDKISFNKKINGKKEGWWKTWYFIGKVKSVSYYKNDVKNGEEIIFYFKGSHLKIMGTYIDGKRNGTFLFLDNHGLFDYYLYENDSLIKKLPPSGPRSL